MWHYEKKIYLDEIRTRYRKRCKKLKTKILDEFCTVCNYHRKHAIRSLGAPFRRIKSKARKRSDISIYNNNQILEPLIRIWLVTDQMCSKKLTAALPLWLPFYENKYAKSDKIKAKLLTISAATIDHLLKPSKLKYNGKWLSGTKPGSLLKNQIPIRTDNCDITKPGFCEADTVAHCGNSSSDDFVWSITLTDILVVGQRTEPPGARVQREC